MGEETVVALSVLVMLGSCVVSVVGPGVELVVTLTVVESLGG